MVATAPLVAMVAESHPLASQDSLSLETLAAEPAIPLDSSPHVDLVTEFVTAERLTPNIAYRSRHFDTVQSLVARGYGYSLTMGMPHANQSMEGLPLRYIPISPGRTGRIEVLVPRTKLPTAATRVLVDECEALFTALLDQD